MKLIKNKSLSINNGIEIGLNFIPFAVLIMDKKLKILFVNNNAEELFSLNKEKLLNINLKELLSEGSAIIDFIYRSKLNKISFFDENLVISGPELKKIKVFASISNIDIESNENQILILNERTNVNNGLNEDDLSLSLQSVSKLSAIISHEIKNPLSGIKGGAQLLLRSNNNENKDIIDMIINETDRICNLLEKVDNAYINQIHEIKKINIHEIIQHSIKVSKSGFAKKINFIEKFDPSIPMIMGDRNLLVQAILNLIKNASEASKGTGEIEIKTSFCNFEPISKDLVGQTRLNPIHIYFKDNGEGVPMNIKNKLFVPFVSSKSNGTGLGLTQVAGTMFSHGGRIELLDTKQTIFRLSFPYKESI